MSGLAEKLSKYFDKRHSATTPARDFVIVDFSMLHKTAVLQLTNLAGLTILERTLIASHQQVDISGVPAGVYVYRIFNSKGPEESGKLVVE
ncbi:MAG TPA: T9SS type A sorting domain-containing protein [Bacteroidales bacterium]|nr:T9SS type A sorting domain-containing protein [Bacteroidales bacterium]HRW97828.1 T9SS type A sorting domain-containing protein [Bacteroidales bacterium]